MSNSELTTAVMFIDGFGGMALTDVSKTHQEIINYLNDESIWEVFDSLGDKPSGRYLVTVRFWWEHGQPMYNDEFITEITSFNLIK